MSNMTINDILNNEDRKKIFPIVLDEACRQWCVFMDDERKTGEGFTNFFFEVFEQKEDEYIGQMHKGLILV